MQRGILFGDLGPEFNQLLLVGQPGNAQILAAEAGVSGDEISHAMRVTFYEALRKGQWSLAWGISLFSQHSELTQTQLRELGTVIGRVFNLTDRAGLQLVAIQQNLRVYQILAQIDGDARVIRKAIFSCTEDHPLFGMLRALSYRVSDKTNWLDSEVRWLEGTALQRLTQSTGQRLFGDYQKYATELGYLPDPKSNAIPTTTTPT